MKRLVILALAAAGCARARPEVEPEPGAEPETAEPKSREEQFAEVRSQVELKRHDLGQADIELRQVADERSALRVEPASEAKTMRMAELDKIEADARMKKRALKEEISALEKQARELEGAPEPASADQALEMALEAEEQRRKEEEERKRRKAEEETSAEKARLVEAERTRAAELAAQEAERRKLESEKAAAASAAAGEDTIFEERWADAILRVRKELEQYKTYAVQALAEEER